MSKSPLFDAIGPFATVPHTVIQMIPRIGQGGYMLWTYLRYRTNGQTGECMPSYDAIQRDTLMTRTAISRAIRLLEATGLLERRRRFSASTIYILKCPAYEPISPTTELMDSSPTNGLIEPCISPNNELPLVQNQDANKISINKKDREPAPAGAASPSARKTGELKPVTRSDLARQCWAIFTRLQGFAPTSVPERARRNTAIKQILDAGGLPDQVERRWQEALQRWNGPGMVNPNSIAAHWEELGTPLPHGKESQNGRTAITSAVTIRSEGEAKAYASTHNGNLPRGSGWHWNSDGSISQDSGGAPGS